MARLTKMSHLGAKMIRELPVDTDRIEFVASGHVNPVQLWVEDPANPGQRKLGTAPNGEPLQATDEATGEPLWTVDAFGESGQEGSERAEVIGVQVRAPYQPTVKKFAPVIFKDLVVRFSKGRDGNLKNYWSATGIVDPTGATTGTKPAPAGNGGGVAKTN